MRRGLVSCIACMALCLVVQSAQAQTAPAIQPAQQMSTQNFGDEQYPRTPSNQYRLTPQAAAQASPSIRPQRKNYYEELFARQPAATSKTAPAPATQFHMTGQTPATTPGNPAVREDYDRQPYSDPFTSKLNPAQQLKQVNYQPSGIGASDPQQNQIRQAVYDRSANIGVTPQIQQVGDAVPTATVDESLAPPTPPMAPPTQAVQPRLQLGNAAVPAMPEAVVPAQAEPAENVTYKEFAASKGLVVEQPAATPRTAEVREVAKPAIQTTVEVSQPAPMRKPLETPAAVGPQQPAFHISWVKPAEINVGQEMTCALKVKNTGASTAYNVDVKVTLPGSAKVTSFQPAPSNAAASSWSFDEIKAGEERTIEVTMLPSRHGEVHASADVRFSTRAVSLLTVLNPMLQVDIAGPEQVLVGEPASQTITISNPGTGIARNVKVKAVIPKGLEHARGEQLVMDVGSLNPGETRTIRLAMTAVDGGAHTLALFANADGDLAAETTSAVRVVAPLVEASITGPGLRYLGRTASYKVSVKNAGTVPSNNVRVLQKVPTGYEFVSADRGVKYDKATRILSWFIGRMEAGKTTEMHVELKAQQIGDFTHYVRATTEQGAQADAQLTTSIDGTPELVLDIRDLDDPVEVGVETAYEVVVKNEGTTPATNVSIACQLPAAMELLSATGPTQHQAEAGSVSFSPIAGINPGQSVKYLLKVRGLEQSNVRLRVQLTSDASPEPLTYEELTRFYGDRPQ